MKNEKNTRFKMIRSELGLSQGDMSLALGKAKQAISASDTEAYKGRNNSLITKTYISYLENGHRPVTPAVSELLCRAFGVNEKWLETGEGDMFLDIQKESQIVERVAALLDKAYSTLESFKELERIAEQYAYEKAENVIIQDNRRIKDVIKLGLAQESGIFTLAEVYKSAVSLAEAGITLCNTLIDEKRNMPFLPIDADKIEQMCRQFAVYKTKYEAERVNVLRSKRVELLRIQNKLIEKQRNDNLSCPLQTTTNEGEESL